MTQTRTKTQFPDPAESPWENPDNGLTYEYNGWGWDIVTADEPDEPEDCGVEISEGLPDEPWEEGDLYFDVSDDELTLYIYLGADWAPAAPPVSLDGIENDILSLQDVANDVKRQLAFQTLEAQKADLKILDLEEGKVAKAGDEISGALKIESPVTKEQPALTVKGTSASSNDADIFKVKASDGRTKFWVDEAGCVGGDSNYREIAKSSSHFVNVRSLKKYLYAPARMEYIVRINKDLGKLNGSSASQSIWMDSDHFAKSTTLIMDGTTVDYICDFKDDVKSGESKKIITSSSSPNTSMLISAWENTDDGGWKWVGTSQVKSMYQKHGHFEIVLGSSEYSKKFTDYGHYFFTISGFF